MSKMFGAEKPTEVEIPEACCTVSESLTVKVLNGKGKIRFHLMLYCSAFSTEKIPSIQF